MASSRPNYEEELKHALDTFITFNAYMEKAKLDPEKYPISEQSMNTYSSLTKEMIHKARDAENNCREYFFACHQSLLRPTRGRVPPKDPEDLIITQPDKDEHNSSPTDSGISSGIIAEETGDAEEMEHLSLTVFTKESNA